MSVSHLLEFSEGSERSPTFPFLIQKMKIVRFRRRCRCCRLLLATFPMTWVRSRWRGHWTTLANSVMDIAAANHGLLLLNGTERYARRYLLASSLANSRAASPRCPPTTPRVRVEFIQNMAHIAHAKAVHGAFCSYTLLIWGWRVLIFHFNLG